MALLRMELNAVNITRVYSRDEASAVICPGKNRLLISAGEIIGVQKIESGAICQVGKQWV